MSLLLISVVSICGIILGKIILKKWFNHLALYCVIMGGVIFLYELKLIRYDEITALTWYIIIASFLSYLFGILTISSIKNLFSKEVTSETKSSLFLPIFADYGTVLKYSIFIFSLLGLIAAIQRWLVMIDMFGSIQSVLLNGKTIYDMIVRDKIKGLVPILPSFSYVAIFLAGIYAAYIGKFSFLTFFAFIGVVLKVLTYFGRAELLLVLMEFIFTFILFRYLLKSSTSSKYKFSKINASFSLLLLLGILIIGVSFIRISRNISENYQGVTSELKQLDDNFFISPSIYFYFSCDIGVLNKYFEIGDENSGFGENTFYFFHTFLNRIGAIEKPVFYSKGYFMPMWANTATFLKDLHTDFGIAGIFIVPYLLGVLITWLWFKFYNSNNLLIFALLVYFFLIIGFSFLLMVTKYNQWYMSLAFILIYIPIMEKLAIRKSLKLIKKPSNKI